MSNQTAKLKGQIERLNHKLSVEERAEGLYITHAEYGFIALITPTDQQPIEIIRECLADISEKFVNKN